MTIFLRKITVLENIAEILFHTGLISGELVVGSDVGSDVSIQHSLSHFMV